MEQMSQLLSQYGGFEIYGLIFILVASCSLGFPLNSDVIMITASTFVGMSSLNAHYLFITMLLAYLTGDSINFFTARKYGIKILSKAPFRWFISEPAVLKARDRFKKFGPKFVFIIRFTPFIRSILWFTAGLLHIDPKKYFAFNITATLIYLAIMIEFGKQIGIWLQHRAIS